MGKNTIESEENKLCVRSDCSACMHMGGGHEWGWRRLDAPILDPPHKKGTYKGFHTACSIVQETTAHKTINIIPTHYPQHLLKTSNHCCIWLRWLPVGFLSLCDPMNMPRSSHLLPRGSHSVHGAHPTVAVTGRLCAPRCCPHV